MFLHPDISLRRRFLLPNRSGAFQLVDAETAGPEGLVPVARRDRNQHDVFPRRQRPDAVNDRYIDHAVLVDGPFPDFPELLFRHAWIAFEMEFGGRYAFRDVPRCAEERNDRADGRGCPLEAGDLLLNRERFALDAYV